MLFEDRGTPHTTDDSGEWVRELDIERRLLPRATPELNARDHLWRHVKGRALADRPTRSIDQSADAGAAAVGGASGDGEGASLSPIARGAGEVLPPPLSVLAVRYSEEVPP